MNGYDTASLRMAAAQADVGGDAPVTMQRHTFPPGRIPPVAQSQPDGDAAATGRAMPVGFLDGDYTIEQILVSVGLGIVLLVVDAASGGKILGFKSLAATTPQIDDAIARAYPHESPAKRRQLRDKILASSPEELARALNMLQPQT